MIHRGHVLVARQLSRDRAAVLAGLLAPLIVLMFAIGLYPNVLTNLMTSVGQAGLAR